MILNQIDCQKFTKHLMFISIQFISNSVYFESIDNRAPIKIGSKSRSKSIVSQNKFFPKFNWIQINSQFCPILLRTISMSIRLKINPKIKQILNLKINSHFINIHYKFNYILTIITQSKSNKTRALSSSWQYNNIQIDPKSSHYNPNLTNQI